jgi:hypothetical protein
MIVNIVILNALLLVKHNCVIKSTIIVVEVDFQWESLSAVVLIDCQMPGGS